MALLAESLVDEWLNRAGFFTVRGIKHGVHEIDLLGVRPAGDQLEAWHVEVQASFRPIGFIAPLPHDALEGFAKSRTSVKERPPELLERAVSAWVDKKFFSRAKQRARERVWPGLSWKFKLVHAETRWPAEIEAIGRAGIETIPLYQVLSQLGKSGADGVRGGAGTDLFDVIDYFHRESRNRFSTGT